MTEFSSAITFFGILWAVQITNTGLVHFTSLWVSFGRLSWLNCVLWPPVLGWRSFSVLYCIGHLLHSLCTLETNHENVDVWYRVLSPWVIHNILNIAIWLFPTSLKIWCWFIVSIWGTWKHSGQNMSIQNSSIILLVWMGHTLLHL